MTSRRKVKLLLGGLAAMAVAVVMRGYVPEVVRYVRIRRM